MDLISALHLRIEGNTVYPPSTSTSPPPSTVSVGHLTTHPASPTTIGCAIGFMHQVKISPTAVPVRQKLRHHPFSVKSAVSEELNRLLSAGVIERIDSLGLADSGHTEEGWRNLNVCRSSQAQQGNHHRQSPSSSHGGTARHTDRSYFIFNHIPVKCISSTTASS